MLEQQATRRTVIGAMAVGTAAIGGIGLLTRGEEPVADGRIAIVPGSGAVPGFRPTPHEVERWTAAVGEPVTLVGETGRVTGAIQSVLPLSTKGQRPVGVRQHPFMVRLSVDVAEAPAGNRSYALSTPIAGLVDVFVTRGADVAGRAILLAVFG